MGLINGRIIADKILDELKIKIDYYQKQYNKVPHLVVVLVGENPSSLSYVAGKEKACQKIGVHSVTKHLDKNISEKELLTLIDELNKDKKIDGILVQLPLPEHIDAQKVIKAIDYNKDVDGFHPYNIAALQLKVAGTIPATPKGIMRILKEENIELEGKNVCVIGRSNIVGLPVAKLLLDKNATVTICHSKTKNLKEITLKADVIVVAIGRAKFITKEMVKPNAVVIDVGINRDDNNKLCGDVETIGISEIATVTKTPGGVGPMTIASLMENTVELFLQHQNTK